MARFASKWVLTDLININIRAPRLDGGMQMIQITPEGHLFKQYAALIKQKGLCNLNIFQLYNASHYMILDEGGKLMAGASIVAASINHMPTGVAVSFEVLVSRHPGCGTVLFEMIRSNLAARKQMCFIVTQSAMTQNAYKFWQKHLCLCMEAKILTYMFALLTEQYKVCVDVYMMSTRV